MSVTRPRNINPKQASKKRSASSLNNSHIAAPNQIKQQYVILSVAAVLLLTAIAYAGSLANGFIVNWDDNVYIMKNPYIGDLAWGTVKKLFTSFYQGNYLPVTMLSYSIDHKIWGLNPTAFHAINMAIHLFNVLLVYRLFRLLIQRFDAALIIALLFGIHPMHVESVAWISERKDVLYTFFFLASVISYLYYLKGKGNYIYLFVSFFMFLFSLLSKSMAVTLPLILLLFDHYNGRKWNWKWLIEKIPFFLLSILFGILAIRSQASAEAMTDLSSTFSSGQRLLIICYSMVFYIIKLFAPLGLCALYYYPTEASEAAITWEFYAAPAALILLIYAIWKSGKYRKDVLFGVLFFFITISIVLQIKPVGQAMVADRYTYVPYLGLFFIIARFCMVIFDRRKKNSAALKSGIMSILVLLALTFSFLTWQRTRTWKDGVTLFSDVIRHYPESFYSYNTRAVGYMEADKPDMDAALKDFSRCIELNPSLAVPYKSRGNILYKQKRFREALADFNAFLSLDHDDAEGFSDRGAAKFGLQDWPGTITDCSHAIQLDPSITAAWINRGNAKGMLQDFAGSVEDYNQAIMRDPSQSGAYLNRGISLMALGKTSEACIDWKMAKQLGNANADGLLLQNCK